MKLRITLQETKFRSHTTQEISSKSGIREDEVLAQLSNLNNRIKSIFGYTHGAIEVNSHGSWRADGIAGILQFNNQVELEIIPKFLATTDEWRTDFFLLAVLVRTGHLLSVDEISAGIQERGDIATLVARTLLKMHASNQRRPIRSYKNSTHTDFSFDGDVDWDTLFFPEHDGFRLKKIELTKQNIHNSVLKGAIDLLIPEVGEDDTRNLLIQLSRKFGPQAAPPKAIYRLPQRHRSWSEAYALSYFVIDGMDLDLNGGLFKGLGFVISTWEAWETLCGEIIRRASTGKQILLQHPFHLGKHRNGNPVFARPDISVLNNGIPEYLFDAKYKTRQDKKPTINSSDLYEGLAFLRAASTRNIFLLYPAIDTIEKLPLGVWNCFDEVQIDELQVCAIQIQIRGISKRGGFNQLVNGAKAALQKFPSTNIEG